MVDKVNRELSVSIVTSAHWEGDPRLNRHVRYLKAAGVRSELVSFADRGRIRGLIAALSSIVRSQSTVVILPDPELFPLGSIAALVSGSKAVIDIHEDYPKVVASRSWIPTLLRPVVGVITVLVVRVGRWMAWRVIVAAPELRQSGDRLVANIPDPSSLEVHEYTNSRHLVYVGDITESRGALEMVDVLGALGGRYELTLIGAIHPELKDTLEKRAATLGVAEQLILTGRLDHREAWALASGALAGLNLLRPVPAYMDAVATKLWEYLALGLPAIVSDLPGQSAIMSEIDPMLACSGVKEVVEVAKELARNQTRRTSISREGRQLVERKWSELRPDRAIQEAVFP